MKKLKNTLVRVAEPCHEDWNKMTPEAQGRFCGSCSKIVVDFSNMSDQQIINHLSRASENACGRFKNNQLNRPLMEELPLKHSRNWLGMAAATLSAVLVIQPLFANNTAFSSNLNLASNPRMVHHKFAYPLYLEFSGVITDAENGAPIPFAKLHIAASGQSTVANADGTFYLKVLTKDYQENPMISITSKGFENVEFDLSIVQREMEISLTRILERLEIDSTESSAAVEEVDGVVHLDIIVERDSHYVMDMSYMMGAISPFYGGAQNSSSSPEKPDIVAQFYNAIVDLFSKKNP